MYSEKSCEKIMRVDCVLFLLLVAFFSFETRAHDVRPSGQEHFAISSCHKCHLSCLMTEPSSKRLQCLKRCDAVSCREKSSDELEYQSEKISQEAFDQLAYFAARELYDELLSDKSITYTKRVNERCSRCKKECKSKGEGYKCYATCANKSFCRYEDNTVTII